MKHKAQKLFKYIGIIAISLGIFQIVSELYFIGGMISIAAGAWLAIKYWNVA